LTETRV